MASLPLVSHPLWRDIAAFVGTDHFRLDWCNSFDAKVLAEYKQYENAACFYQQTDVYLYHLAACWLEGLQHVYLPQVLADLARCVTRPTLLDYGCGIGCVGYWLLQAGYRVDFIDMPSRSLEFLQWRLHREGFTAAQVFALPADASTVHCLSFCLPHYDALWCCDVLEHLPPIQHRPLLLQLETLADTVYCNLVADPLADHTVHYPVDVDGLTQWIADRRRLEYVDFYQGKVRFLKYGKWAQI